MLASAAVIKGLTGTGRSVSKMTHSCSGQAGVDCWQETSVLCHVDLSTELLEYNHDLAAHFPQSEYPREQSRSRNVFYYLALEVTLLSIGHPDHL